MNTCITITAGNLCDYFFLTNERFYQVLQFPWKLLFVSPQHLAFKNSQPHKFNPFDPQDPHDVLLRWKWYKQLYPFLEVRVQKLLAQGLKAANSKAKVQTQTVWLQSLCDMWKCPSETLSPQDHMLYLLLCYTAYSHYVIPFNHFVR